ncbi:MAG: aminoacyl-tRNA hydrolase [Oscillospiraceae bacterium]|nr:aminoacyl-tRNA hydrolase [Oscillospiraceae bacterium]
MFRKIKNIFGKKNAAPPVPPVFGPVEFIAAGLGNPGRGYENNRHNAGFMAVDYIARQLGFAVKQSKFKALCGESMVAGKRVLFLKPSTFMNKSGESIRDAMAFYKVPIERLVVFCDDTALDIGKMRIRKKGSDGGQKGLRSIINQTGRDDFTRIRIGVGAKPHPEMDLADWVLSNFTTQEKEKLRQMLENSMGALELIVGGDTDAAMNRYN